MGWVDRVVPLLAPYTGQYPLDFLLGWIQHESGGKNTRAGSTSLGEAGFFQIHPETARDLGIDINRVFDDEAYSVESGMKMLDYYRRSTDTSVWPLDSQAYFGAIKLRHALPLLANTASREIANAGLQFQAWDEAADWIKANLPAYLHAGSNSYSTSHWVDNVSAVLSKGAKLAAGLPPFLVELTSPSVAVPLGLLVVVGIGLYLYHHRR